MKLTDKDIEYINNKPERKDGIVLSRILAEVYLEDSQIGIEDLKKSPYYVDRHI